MSSVILILLLTSTSYFHFAIRYSLFNINHPLGIGRIMFRRKE